MSGAVGYRSRPPVTRIDNKLEGFLAAFIVVSGADCEASLLVKEILLQKWNKGEISCQYAMLYCR